MRIGQGYDAHRYADDDRDLVLGGVQFLGERGLHGHSDADVVAHAVIDALLGAAGLGDIGMHFPDTDPMFAGADSIELLRRTAMAVRAAGYRPVNVDCTVIADRPRISTRREEMQRILSEAAGVPVTVCGKTTEGIGALGRGEGVVGLAVALVDEIDGTEGNGS